MAGRVTGNRHSPKGMAALSSQNQVEEGFQNELNNRVTDFSDIVNRAINSLDSGGIWFMILEEKAAHLREKGLEISQLIRGEMETNQIQPKIDSAYGDFIASLESLREASFAQIDHWIALRDALESMTDADIGNLALGTTDAERKIREDLISRLFVQNALSSPQTQLKAAPMRLAQVWETYQLFSTERSQRYEGEIFVYIKQIAPPREQDLVPPSN